MKAVKERDEILRLVDKIKRGSGWISGSRTKTAAPVAPTPLRRRQELAALKEKRAALEKAVLNGGFYELYQRLEARLASLERVIQGRDDDKHPIEPLFCTPEKKTTPGSKLDPGSELGDYSLSGKIQEGILADMLQMISSNMMTGRFLIQGEKQEITLYFSEGHICHADGEGLSGERAFFAAMALERGMFYFRETKEIPQERTIESQTQFLILEGLRQIDEARAKE